MLKMRTMQACWMCVTTKYYLVETKNLEEDVPSPKTINVYLHTDGCKIAIHTEHNKMIETTKEKDEPHAHRVTTS
jgi:hypothetical protein